MSNEKFSKLVSDSRIMRMTSNDLDNNILSLIIIDSNNRAVKVINSISSSRAYFFHFQNNSLRLSTSIKEIKASGIKLELNETSLPEFYLYRYVTPPKTLYSDICKLIGGESILFELKEGVSKKRNFFDFSTSETDKNESDYEIATNCFNILKNNIHQSSHLTDAPSLLLSGGLDSSLLGMIPSMNGKPVKSFSSSFSFINDTDIEDEYAQTAAKHLKLNHEVISGTKEEYLCSLVDAIYATEEPLHHLQSVMLYILFKKREESSFLLCGEGADRLFGNNAHVTYNKNKSLISFLQHSGMRHLVKMANVFTGKRNYRLSYFSKYFGSSFISNDNFLWTMGQFTDLKDVKEITGCSASDIFESYRNLLQPYANESFLNKVSILSLLSEGSITITLWSKLAEANKIVLHYPFASKDLILYVYSISWQRKLKEQKFIIREMLRNGGFPEQFINRSKKSFGFPAKFWALPGGLFQSIIDMAQEMYDKTVLESFQSVEPGKPMMLWNMISLYLWKKLMIDGTAPDVLKNEILNRHKIIEGKK